MNDIDDNINKNINRNTSNTSIEATQIFEKDLAELNILLDHVQKEQFHKYYELLIEWNNQRNLTTITEYHEVMKKHFIDSLSLVHYDLDLQKGFSLMDVGTGAGFPGLPLKIVFPDLRITLLDSLNKRVEFLNHVISELGLKNIVALHGRAEDYARNSELREQFDLCVSRAVANLSVLAEYCLPYVKVGGFFISYKSEKVAEEMETAQAAITVLGGKPAKQVSFSLPNSEIARTLWGIEKIKSTPDKYPRKAGLPAKKPL